MPSQVEFRYRAFLSYAHADVRWGRWLHSRLESFRIDKALVGRDTQRGPVPATLRPIFRDREDFSGGHTLTDATIAALDASATLIVLCSPVAATRPAVNEEVRLFRWRHPERPVIPVIIDGTWPDNVPPALRFEITSDGRVSDRAVTILGPDLREIGDGRELGVAKIVAGLTGVGADDIYRRAQRAARRRMARFVAGLAAVATALAGLAIWAEVNRREAVEQRLIAENRRLEAERNFALAKSAADSLIVDVSQGLRDTEGLRASAVTKILGTARRTIERLASAAPDNLDLQRSRMVMLSEFGDTFVAAGDLPAAIDSFRAALDIADRLARHHPEDLREWRNQSVMQNKVADVLRSKGDLRGSLDMYQLALSTRRRLATAEPLNLSAQRDLFLSENKLADVRMQSGATADGVAGYRAALQIAQGLVAAEPQNNAWQRDLAYAHEKWGDVVRAMGRRAESAESYRNSLAIRQRVSAADPDNTARLRDVSVAMSKLANVLLEEGKVDEGLQSYSSALAISKRLAERDPGNLGWQRDLSVSHEKIGDVHLAQGQHVAASASYRASLSIRERLASADQGNAGWQRDLAAAHWKLAQAGDERRQNLQAVVRIFRDMKTRGVLAPADEQFLPWAEAELAKQ